MAKTTFFFSHAKFQVSLTLSQYDQTRLKRRTLRMETTAPFHQAVGTNRVYGIGHDFSFLRRFGKHHMRIIPMGFGTDKALLRTRSPCLCSLCSIDQSKFNSSVQDPNLSHSSSETNDSIKAKDESVLILIRHGESMWNEKNLFTGSVDVPLTRKGVVEAIEAGKRISSIPIDIIYTSALVRSQMTAMLALTQHCCGKVPIILHSGSEEDIAWSQIYSKDANNESIPVIKAWQLNERMYGELQGFNKQETAEKYGKEQVHKWRRSYDVRPPNGESLEMCLQRAVSFFKDHIEPQLLQGKHVMITAHANSLRSIIMHLENLTSQEVIPLELSTGVPMLYIYRERRFIRRGSPVGSTEAGVYAYSEGLALYRKKLEEMLL